MPAEEYRRSITLANDKAGAATLDGYSPVLTTDQVCSILRINRKTLYKLIANGEIPGRKSGKGYKITKEAVIAHLNR